MLRLHPHATGQIKAKGKRAVGAIAMEIYLLLPNQNACQILPMLNSSACIVGKLCRTSALEASHLLDSGVAVVLRLPSSRKALAGTYPLPKEI
jgi:hypothetical protein